MNEPERKASVDLTRQSSLRCAVVPLSPCQVFREIAPNESLVRVAIPRKGLKKLAETISTLLKNDVRSDYFGIDLHVEERELDGELIPAMAAVEDIAREEVARRLYRNDVGLAEPLTITDEDEEKGLAFYDLTDGKRDEYNARATAEIQTRIREKLKPKVPDGV